MSVNMNSISQTLMLAIGIEGKEKPHNKYVLIPEVTMCLEPNSPILVARKAKVLFSHDGHVIASEEHQVCVVEEVIIKP